MKYLVELVFGIGFFGLGAIALTFFLRFLLLTWAVRLVGRIIQSILSFTRRLCHAVIFIFGPAMLGGFIVGLGLQLAFSSGNTSVDPVQPVLLAFLAFFVIIAFRAWQWNSRGSSAKPGRSELASSKFASPVDRLVADAWARAIALAPSKRHDLQVAQAACCSLLTAVEVRDNMPDDTLIETETLIRDHLAALVDSTERHLHGGSACQKDAAIAEMVKFLLAFGDRARRDLLVATTKIDAQDTAMRAHLEAKLFQ